MKHTVFTGSAVALVTPMHPDLSVNYEKLGELIEFHIQNETDAIVVVGTTGEGSTLTDEGNRIHGQACSRTYAGDSRYRKQQHRPCCGAVKAG